MKPDAVIEPAGMKWLQRKREPKPALRRSTRMTENFMMDTPVANQRQQEQRHKKTSAQLAFAASGLTYEQVARRVDVSPDYLRGLLRRGCDCYVTADRIRRVLGCPVEYFLPRPRATKTAAKQKRMPSKINNEREDGGTPKGRKRRTSQEAAHGAD